MTITVISKHLASSAQYFHLPAGSRVLNMLHLVESARYHLSRFEELASSIGHVPNNFKSGLDIDKSELDHYYRFMASFFEIESFLFSVKRLFDHAWLCIGEPFGEGAERIRTLAKAVYNMKSCVKSKISREKIQTTEFFKILVLSYKDWGDKAAKIRNYVEHVAPLGGIANNYQISLNNNRQVFDPFLPDKLPDKDENISKKKLTYNYKLSFTEYLQTTMDNVDGLIEALLNTKEELLFVKT